LSLLVAARAPMPRDMRVTFKSGTLDTPSLFPRLNKAMSKAQAAYKRPAPQTSNQRLSRGPIRRSGSMSETPGDGLEALDSVIEPPGIRTSALGTKRTKPEARSQVRCGRDCVAKVGGMHPVRNIKNVARGGTSTEVGGRPMRVCEGLVVVGALRGPLNPPQLLSTGAPAPLRTVFALGTAAVAAKGCSHPKSMPTI